MIAINRLRADAILTDVKDRTVVVGDCSENRFRLGHALLAKKDESKFIECDIVELNFFKTKDGKPAKLWWSTMPLNNLSIEQNIVGLVINLNQSVIEPGDTIIQKDI